MSTSNIYDKERICIYTEHLYIYRTHKELSKVNNKKQQPTEKFINLFEWTLLQVDL